MWIQRCAFALETGGKIDYYRFLIMPYSRSWRYWILVIGAAVWLLLLFVPPYLESGLISFSGLSYACYGSVCHQLPERSLWIWGSPLGVCARCFGLYSGFLIGLLAFPYLNKLSGKLLDHPRLLLLFFLPMAFDLLVSNTAASRLFSGAIASFPIALFVWVAIEGLPSWTQLRRNET
jgi:uncharacterized membrane protein